MAQETNMAQFNRYLQSFGPTLIKYRQYSDFDDRFNKHLFRPISDLDLREGDLLCGAHSDRESATVKVSKVYPNGDIELTFLNDGFSFPLSAKTKTYLVLFSRDSESMNICAKETTSQNWDEI